MTPSSAYADGPADEHAPVGSDIVLISDYLSHELSMVEMERVETRLTNDANFRLQVQGLLEADALPQTFSHEFGVSPATSLAAVASAQEIAAGWRRFARERHQAPTERTPNGSVLANIGNAQVKSPRHNGWRIAAAVTILMGGLSYLAITTDLLYGLEGPASESVSDKLRALFNRTRITSSGERQHVDLKHGSTAILSPLSQLVYRPGGSGTGLVMSLRGEAIIDVSPASGGVFLGTRQARTTLAPGRYNVRASANDSTMFVAVESGSITISPRGSEISQQVNAGQSAEVIRQDITVANVPALASPDMGARPVVLNSTSVRVAPLQTEFKFRLTKSFPSGTPVVYTEGARVPKVLAFTQRTSAIVTMMIHDSAGGTVWEMLIDTTFADMPKTADAPSMPPPTKRSPTGLRPTPPRLYRVFRKGSEVTALEVTKNNAAISLALPEDPMTSLLLLATGWAVRVPKQGLPAVVGAKVNESIQSELPTGVPGQRIDTTSIVWRRTAANTLTMNLELWGPTPRYPASVVKWLTSVAIRFDEQQRMEELHSVDGSVDPSTPRGSALLPDIVLMAITVSLTRLP